MDTDFYLNGKLKAMSDGSCRADDYSNASMTQFEGHLALLQTKLQKTEENFNELILSYARCVDNEIRIAKLFERVESSVHREI